MPRKSKATGWRSKASYRGKTAAARERQTKNLNYCKRGNPDDKLTSINPPARLRKLSKMDIMKFGEDVLGVSFKERPAQEVILRSLYGMPLDKAQQAIYTALTTNKEVFEGDKEKTESCWAVGARGGKSTLCSIIALYESICRGEIWKQYLQPGETGYCILIATRETQSIQIIQRNAARLLRDSSISYFIEKEQAKELILVNGLRILSVPCNSTAARGLPIYCLMFDEQAHYRMEGVKADSEIDDALRPRQAQFPGAKCLQISTPSGKQGLFWETFDEGFKVPGRLTIHASTRQINPVIPQDFIDKRYARDPDVAAREFGAVFAEQVSGFFESCMDKLKSSFTSPAGEDFPYVSGVDYFAAIDQSGLTGNDRWGFAICHNDRTTGMVMVDSYREWATKNLRAIMTTIKELCNSFSIRKLKGDRYAKGLIEQLLNEIGIELEIRDTLPAVYVAFKTLIVSSAISLPNDDSLKSSLMRTQAFYGRSNTLSIGQERTKHGHGDLANALVTAAVDASKAPNYSATPVLAGVGKEDTGDYDIMRFGL